MVEGEKRYVHRIGGDSEGANKKPRMTSHT